jgi:molybdopterin synthase sulfur carrier subunit
MFETMVTLKIKAFGITKDILGSRDVELTLAEENTVSGLRKMLGEKFPHMKGLKSLYIAVDNEYAEDSHVLTGEEEIALIPPVSGG